jgi:ribosome-binding protein aMBF1 (putative translation factor)
MNQTTTFKTPSGDDMIVMPRALYEKLLSEAETAQDVTAYDKAKARLASGEDELVPASIANRLLDGENKVRVWREQRAMPAWQLAKQANISASYLSDIQNGKKVGSVAAMKAIAAALKVDLDDLI